MVAARTGSISSESFEGGTRKPQFPQSRFRSIARYLAAAGPPLARRNLSGTEFEFKDVFKHQAFGRSTQLLVLTHVLTTPGPFAW